MLGSSERSRSYSHVLSDIYLDFVGWIKTFDQTNDDVKHFGKSKPWGSSLPLWLTKAAYVLLASSFIWLPGFLDLRPLCWQHFSRLFLSRVVGGRIQWRRVNFDGPPRRDDRTPAPTPCQLECTYPVSPDRPSFWSGFLLQLSQLAFLLSILAMTASAGRLRWKTLHGLWFVFPSEGRLGGAVFG